MRPAVPPSRKPARAHVRRGPDEVADALEAEHRVVDEERNRVDAVRRVRRARGDERRHRSGFGDPFLENLAVLRFVVIEQHVAVDRLVELADARIDAAVRNSDSMPNVRASSGTIGTIRCPISGSAASCAACRTKAIVVEDSRPAAALQKLLEELVVGADETASTHIPLRNVSAELRAPRLQILDLRAVLGRPIERPRRMHSSSFERNLEARAEFAQLFFVELLLLVRDVLAFARFAQAVALDRSRQDDGRRALVLHGGFVRGVDLARIVAAEAQPPHLRRRQVLDQLQQPRIGTEEMLADVGAGVETVSFWYSPSTISPMRFDQQAFRSLREDRVPLAAPDEP